MLLLGLISSKSLLAEYHLVTVISTYKTILYLYALVIMDLMQRTPISISHSKQCERWSRISC